VLIWGFAILGIIFKIKFGHKYKKISLASYLGMGFIALAILGELYQALPIEALYLLFLGGIIYATGVIFYVKKKHTFYPYYLALLCSSWRYLPFLNDLLVCLSCL
jgi:channel protein (hemolysin III family)